MGGKKKKGGSFAGSEKKDFFLGRNRRELAGGVKKVVGEEFFRSFQVSLTWV